MSAITVLCLNCQHENREGAVFCENCGDPLKRACPTCHEKNWVSAQQCAHCGRPLDVLEQLAERHSQSTADYLNQARQEARVIKATEEQAAERRSAALWYQERQLQEARDAAAARQADHERRTMRFVYAAFLIFGLALAIGLAVIALR